MRPRIFLKSLLIHSLLLIHTAVARDVLEEAGGFRYTISDAFELKENPRRSISPQTQFAIAFSRSSSALFVPAGWESAPIEKAVEATIQLAAEGFGLKVTGREESEHFSDSGIRVSKILLRTEGEFSYFFVLAFSLDAKGAIAYTLIPGRLTSHQPEAVCEKLIRSLEKTN